MRKGREQRSICIGVVGTYAGADTTKFAIGLAHALQRVYRKRTALLELNGSQRLRKIEEYYKPGKNCYDDVDTWMYDIHKVDYYKRIGHRELLGLLGQEYEYYVLDFGCEIAKRTEEIYLCQHKVLIGSSMPWNIQEQQATMDYLESKEILEQFARFEFGVGDCREAFGKSVPDFHPYYLGRTELRFFINNVEE